MSPVAASRGPRQFPLRRWLSTLLGAACLPATDRASSLPADVLLSRGYVELLHSGVPLLPNFAVDAAAWFSGESRARFEAPRHLPAPLRAVMEPYVEFLNGDRMRTMLHAAAEQARDPGSRRWDTADAAPARTCFLRLAALQVPRVRTPIDWPAVLRAWSSDVVRGALNDALSKPDEPALKVLQDFFAQFAALRVSDGTDAPPRSVVRSSLELVVLAERRTPSGFSGLDLPLLEASTRYRPFADPSSDHDQVRRRMAAQRHSVDSHVPEFGVFGITKKRQTLLTARRSELARDDFFERYWCRDVSYYIRRGPRLVPRRMQLTWVINRGTTTTGSVESVVARHSLLLSARFVEDAVRRLAPIPAFHMAVVLVVHNGVSDAGFRCRTHAITPLEMLRAPAINDGQSLWFPGLTSVFPSYFQRRPEWAEPPAIPVSGSTAAERAVAVARRTALVLAAADDAAGDFDLVVTTVCEPSAAPGAADLWGRLRRGQHGYATTLLLFDKDGVDRRSTLRRNRDADGGTRYSYDADAEPLRRRQWAALWQHVMRAAD